MEHNVIPAGEIHSPYNWRPANESARNGLSVGASDVGKLAFQVDTGETFVLTDDSPATWRSIQIVAWDDVTGKPTFAAVATSGDYDDLSNTPSLAAVATSGSYADLSGTPSLATVATSGDYDDLADKPTLGTLAALSYPGGTSTFLRADGTFAAPPGGSGGAVDSVNGQTGDVVLAAADIAVTPAGSIAATDVQAALEELDDEKQPLDAELSAIAGLTSDANKLPYFTGSGTAALADFSAAGRALVDDADAAAQRTTLGLATVAATGAYSDLTGKPTLGTAAALDISTDGTLAGNSDTLIPTQKAVKTYADQLIGAADVMVFKGVIDASTNPNYPAADAGWLYRISVAGKIGGASGVNVEVGDTILCLADGTSSGNQATVGASWSISQANLDGAVIGPASAVNNRVAFFDGTTGKLIKDSGLTLSGTNTGDQTTITGNAGTATALQTARTIDGQSFDGTANITVIAPGTVAATAKTTPVDADVMPLADSAASNVLKKVTWANIKATLKTYFDAIYSTLASPTFTGTPAAPTATRGTTTTQIATTAFARTPSVQAVTSAATVTPTFADDMVKITAQAAGLTLANPTGTAIDGAGMVIRIKDNGTARSISYGTQYRAIGVTLPTTTVVSKTLYLAMVYNTEDTTWDVLAVGQQA